MLIYAPAAKGPLVKRVRHDNCERQASAQVQRFSSGCEAVSMGLSTRSETGGAEFDT